MENFGSISYHRLGESRLRRFRNDILKGLLWIGLALLLLYFYGSAQAAESEMTTDNTMSGGIDAVLIIDSSGSMKQTDPKRLRVPAAKMFVNLLGEQDRIGLISFSDNGYPVVHLTPATQDNQERVFSGVEKVSAMGAYTNLHAALQKGVEMLNTESDSSRRRMLVLMSDGKMDVGDWDQDQQLLKDITDKMVPALNKEGIEVYTIAFTEASDMSLMQQIAVGTGAMSRMASNDRELHDVFSTIFESAKQPDMLPMDEGDFVVDDSVSEVTLVASKSSPGDEIYLVMPDGRRMSSANAGRAVRWFQSQLFDMITIMGPPAGKWHLVAEGGNNRAYIVTNLGMEAAFGDGDYALAEEEVASIRLIQDGETLTRPEILENTVFGIEIQQPDGELLQMPLVDSGMAGDTASGDGIYSGLATLVQPGQYKIRFVAKGETFQREKVVFVDIPETAEDMIRSEQPAEPEMAPKAEPMPEPEPVAEPEPEPEPAPVLEEEVIEEPPAEEETVSLAMIFGVFIGLNVLIGLGVGAFFLIRNRRRSKQAGKAKDADTAADESPEKADE